MTGQNEGQFSLENEKKFNFCGEQWQWNNWYVK